MASNESTPAEVLEAPEVTTEVVPGTTFMSFNRRELRARGHRGSYEKQPKKWAGAVKTAPHWMDDVRKMVNRQG